MLLPLSSQSSSLLPADYLFTSIYTNTLQAYTKAEKFLHRSRRPKTTTKTAIPNLHTLLQAPVIDFWNLDAKKAFILANKLSKIAVLYAKWAYKDIVAELLDEKALII